MFGTGKIKLILAAASALALVQTFNACSKVGFTPQAKVQSKTLGAVISQPGQLTTDNPAIVNCTTNTPPAGAENMGVRKILAASAATDPALTPHLNDLLGNCSAEGADGTSTDDNSKDDVSADDNSAADPVAITNVPAAATAEMCVQVCHTESADETSADDNSADDASTDDASTDDASTDDDSAATSP